MSECVYIPGVVDKYPKEILKGRVNTEGNVVGCMINDMLLVDDTNIDTDKFLTKSGRLVYGILKVLRSKGCAICDDVSYETYINENVKNELAEYGGFRALKNIADCVNDKNYESYLDDLLKSNIIINMYEFGFNLTKPIDCDGKSIIPLKLFDKMDSEQVTEWYESKLEGFSTGYSSKVLEDEDLDITDEFIDSLQEGEEAGTPFEYFDDDIEGKKVPALPYFSKVVNGIPDGFTIIGGYSNVGKTTLVISILMSLMHSGRKCMIISNEQRSKVFKIGFLLLILTKHLNYFNLTKTKMINGNINELDREYIKKAQEYWRENYKGKLHFISIPDSDVSLAIKKMRVGILTYGYDTLVYDTFKCDWSSNSNDSTWVSLIKDSRKFESLARKYPGTQVICTLQLAINTLGKLFLDSSVLSMSKQIKEVCDLMILCRTIYQDEFDQNSNYYCNPFKSVLDSDGKWTEQPWIPKQNKTYRAVFIEKNRSGTVSSDTGIGYIFGFQGEWGIWSDSAKARFKHGYIQ